MKLTVSRQGSCGQGSIELLLSLPIVLMLGLGALQAYQLLSAKLAVNFAAQEAVRAGTVAHADPAAIQEGFARGITPWLLGATDYANFQANVLQANAVLAQRAAEQSFIVRQLSPTEQSFTDWAVPAIDENGELVPTTLEIPNDNLHFYKSTRQPTSGVSASRGSEPIGSASGQTLLDANTLKVEFIFAVEANVPIIGPITTWAASIFSGCAASTQRQLGLVNLGSPPAPSNANVNSVTCTNLQAGRIPIQAQATMGMQSAARKSGSWPARAQTANADAGLAVGAVDPNNRLVQPSQLNAAGVGVGQPVGAREVGYSKLGSGRELPAAGGGVDPAVCSP